MGGSPCFALTRMDKYMSETLRKIENQLQNLFENSVSRLLQKDRFVSTLTSALIEALQIEKIATPEGTWVAPVAYEVGVPSQWDQKIQNEEGLVAQLTEALILASQEADIRVTRQPTITFIHNSTAFFVEAIPYREALNDTLSLDLSSNDEQEIDKNLTYLIDPEGRFFYLKTVTTNIGRAQDNDMVLTHVSVSRYHAQIRLSSGRRTLFDLDSRGGTFVNGERVNQRELVSGDVIKLADIPLIFSEEQSGSTTETKPFARPEETIL